MKDGIYLDVFAVKNGVKYKIKTMFANDVVLALTNSLMDGFESVLKPEDFDEGDAHIE